MIQTSRRGFLIGLGCAVAAPAIVKYTNIMPVRNRLIGPWTHEWTAYYMGDKSWHKHTPEQWAKWGIERLVLTERKDKRPWALRHISDVALAT